MNIPAKQTILFPFGENRLPLHPLANIDQCMKSYKKEVGYFFTPEQLNEYTQRVIKEALETAAETQKELCICEKEICICCDKSNSTIKSITNTFEETYKKFEV